MLIDAVLFLVILSILIFVHELGHFLVAKLHHVAVEEFGFGIPPRIYAMKRGETEFSLNLLPIGGFVRLRGEEGESSDPRSLAARPTHAKIQIIAAGVVFNLLFAFLVFFASYAFFAVPEYSATGYPLITTVAPDSPAYQAGIRLGDKPYALVAGTGTIPVRTPSDFIAAVRAHAGQNVSLLLTRSGTPLSVSVTPRENPPAGEGPLGVEVLGVAMVHYPLGESFVKAGEKLFGTVQVFLISLGNLVSSTIRLAPQAGGVTGPIGLFGIFEKTKFLGIGYILGLMGTVSLSLALVNILPFPALDGGRIFFILLNKNPILKVSPEVEGLIHQTGMVLLLLLAALVALKDIRTTL